MSQEQQIYTREIIEFKKNLEYQDTRIQIKHDKVDLTIDIQLHEL